MVISIVGTRRNADRHGTDAVRVSSGEKADADGDVGRSCGNVERTSGVFGSGL